MVRMKCTLRTSAAFHQLRGENINTRGMNLPPVPPPPPSISTGNNSKPSVDKDEGLLVDSLKKWLEIDGFRNENFWGVWKDVPTILQNGPQCGLVSLSMAASLFGLTLPVDVIYKTAVEMGATKQGEMFEASSLVGLARKLGLNATIHDGMSEFGKILQYLREGKFLLIPYDADRDHRPCLKNGHKAHWALITGFLLKSNARCDLGNSNNQGVKLHKIDEPVGILENVTIEKSNIFLLAKHGKSRHTAVWYYQQLESSNLNLKEVDPLRRNEDEYVIPRNASLCEDLCGKIIVISGHRTTV